MCYMFHITKCGLLWDASVAVLIYGVLPIFELIILKKQTQALTVSLNLTSSFSFIKCALYIALAIISCRRGK